MIKVKVEIREKGKREWQEYEKRFKQLKGAYVTIGVHEDAGKYQGSRAPLVAEVALWNEFGTQDIPSRPFLALALDKNIGKINDWRMEAIDRVLNEGWPVKRAMEMIGFRVQVLIQNQIKSNTPPPNAPSTIRAKQRSGVLPKELKSGPKGVKTSTLIDTGLLLRSITYKVFVK